MRCHRPRQCGLQHAGLFLRLQRAGDQCTRQAASAPSRAHADEFRVPALGEPCLVLLGVDSRLHLAGHLIGAHVPCKLPEVRLDVRDAFHASKSPGLGAE